MTWVTKVAPPVWANVLERAMSTHSINTPKRQAMFVAQCAHETGGFKVFVENLNYSAQGLIATWPKRFSPMVIADRYAHNAVMIGNRAYADRLGNGTEATGDGYKYRGRGCIQITGRSNYAAAGDALRYPLLTVPDAAAEPPMAAEVAAWFWETHGCSALADRNDFIAITRAINGGLNGLADRQHWLDQCYAAQAGG